MPSNPIIRKVTVTTAYQPLSATPVVGSFTISAPPNNQSNVLFMSTADSPNTDVPWVPGEYHNFEGIDLASIKVKGQAGDLVTIVGGTR